MAIILIRTVILFFSLLLTMRLLGKRQLGELELSELVVGVVVADLASNPLQDIGIPLLNGLVPIVVLFCCELLISGFPCGISGSGNSSMGGPASSSETGDLSSRHGEKPLYPGRAHRRAPEPGLSGHQQDQIRHPGE